MEWDGMLDWHSAGGDSEMFPPKRVLQIPLRPRGFAERMNGRCARQAEDSAESFAHLSVITGYIQVAGNSKIRLVKHEFDSAKTFISG